MHQLSLHRSFRLAAVTAAASLLFTSFASAAIYYVDLGPNATANNSNGQATPSPASNGVFYNNFTFPGPNFEANATPTPVTDAVSSTGVASTIDISGSGFKANGGSGVGGLLSPDPALLGDFALATVTGDYFFVEGLPAAPATGAVAYGTVA